MLNLFFTLNNKNEFYCVITIVIFPYLPVMRLHHFAQKIVPVIAAVLLLLSHSKNVVKKMQTIDLPGVVSIWK